MQYIFTFLIFITAITVSKSQIGIISDKLTNKLQRQLEDKIVDAIANEIYKKAFKPADEAANEAMRKSFEDSTNVDYKNAGKAYREFIYGLNEAVTKLPSEYTFDVICDITTKDHKNKINELKMLYKKDGSIIGYQTAEKNKISTVVFDVKNEIMVMYTEEKGKKTGQVLPSMHKFIGALASDQIEKQSQSTMNVKKTGSKKMFAGYESSEYIIELEEMTNQVYIAENFPVTYQSVYGPFLMQFTPAAYSESPEVMKGFAMYSKTADKNKKDTNEYEVVKVSLEHLKINTADYKFEQNK